MGSQRRWWILASQRHALDSRQPWNYTKWSDMGLADWSWVKVEPYFKKIENVSGFLDKSQSHVRGHDGPVQLRKPGYSFEWPK